MSAFRPWLLVPAVMLAACAPDRVVSVDATAAPITALAPRTGGPSAALYVDDDPHFVTAAAGAPSVANPVVQFWAKRGEDRTATMYYHSTNGRDSVPFFSLRVRAKSLWRRPDGSPIADGDSVLITLTLVDSTRLVVDCQPSGLLFSPNDPARLRMSYAETDADVNGDGVVNATDQTLTQALIVWRQESPTSPWLPILTSKNSTSADEVEADIAGFTGYAIAY